MKSVLQIEWNTDYPEKLREVHTYPIAIYSTRPATRGLWHIYLLQFTGLLDKNGKEIYEGDIATHRKAGDFDKKELVTGEIVIEPTRGVVIGGWPASFDIEVIGNIYENPELLK